MSAALAATLVLMWSFPADTPPNPDATRDHIGFVVELNDGAGWEHVLTISDPSATKLEASRCDLESAVGHPVGRPFLSVQTYYGNIPPGPRFVLGPFGEWPAEACPEPSPASLAGAALGTLATLRRITS
jgi:hypothetical protein